MWKWNLRLKIFVFFFHMLSPFENYVFMKIMLFWKLCPYGLINTPNWFNCSKQFYVDWLYGEKRECWSPFFSFGTTIQLSHIFKVQRCTCMPVQMAANCQHGCKCLTCHLVTSADGAVTASCRKQLGMESRLHIFILWPFSKEFLLLHPVIPYSICECCMEF